MKNLIKMLSLALLIGFGLSLSAQNELSKEDRKKAITSLKDSQSALKKSIKGLSEDQLNFKANEESWSIAECVEHLATSEKNLFALVQQTLKSEADPSKKSELKFSDKEIVEFIEDRSSKIKTQSNLEPQNSYGSYEGSKNEFKTLRKQHIKYVKKTDDDLRSHFFDFPFGKVDSYQIILFMSGHTSRHTKQIQEVLADPSFPAG